MSPIRGWDTSSELGHLRTPSKMLPLQSGMRSRKSTARRASFGPTVPGKLSRVRPFVVTETWISMGQSPKILNDQKIFMASNSLRSYSKKAERTRIGSSSAACLARCMKSATRSSTALDLSSSSKLRTGRGRLWHCLINWSVSGSCEEISQNDITCFNTGPLDKGANSLFL